MMGTNWQIVAFLGLLFTTFGNTASTFRNGHPSCRQRDNGGRNVTICECSGNGLVSTLCDFSAIPNDVFVLSVGTMLSTYGDSPLKISTCSTTNGAPVLDPSAVPLARETHLLIARFCSVDFDAGRAGRLSLWLDNVKHSLKQLIILEGKLTRLPASFLAGFEGLMGLSIVRTGLKLIELDAFSEMGAQPSLRSLTLTGNKLQTFDWAHLRIVASTLDSVVLENNSISTMETTSYVAFPKLSLVDLQGNNMTKIPLSVLYMWANTTPTARSKTVRLQRNPLCPTANCRCSSLIPLITYNQDPESKAPLRMESDCGRDVELKWESTDPYNVGTCYRRPGFGRFLTNGDCKQLSDNEDFSPQLAVEKNQTGLPPKTVLEHNYDNFAQ